MRVSVGVRARLTLTFDFIAGTFSGVEGVKNWTVIAVPVITWRVRFRVRFRVRVRIRVKVKVRLGLRLGLSLGTCAPLEIWGHRITLLSA